MPPSMVNYGIQDTGIETKESHATFPCLHSFVSALAAALPRRVFRVIRGSLLLSALLTSCLLHAADNSPVTIVAFGDSTTAPRGPLRVYADILRDELPKHGVKASVVNAGVGGNHTVAARKRFQRDVLDRKPAIVIVQFGINDAAVDVWKKPPATKPRVALKTYEANLRLFIGSIRKAGARPILMTPNPLRWTPRLKKLYGKPPYDPDNANGFNLLLMDYAAAVRAIAAEERVPLIDIDRAMTPEIDNLLLDGMHPNAAGHQLVADRLIPIVLREIKRHPSPPQN